METRNLLETLVGMSRSLGEPAKDYAMLGEGNTSARLDEESFLVKASGFRLQDIGSNGFVRLSFSRCGDLLERTEATDLEVKVGLQAACLEPGETRMPSVEAVLHAILLQMPGVQFVGHTHPVAANQILCSGKAREAFAGRIFPDEIVVCGVAPCMVDYIDPGLPLARGVRHAVEQFSKQHGEFPKVICLINHGIFTVGRTANEVLATTDMFVKVCRILQGTFALGGPQFLTPANVQRIHTRPDEHYRQGQLGLKTSG